MSVSQIYFQRLKEKRCKIVLNGKLSGMQGQGMKCIGITQFFACEGSICSSASRSYMHMWKMGKIRDSLSTCNGLHCIQWSKSTGLEYISKQFLKDTYLKAYQPLVNPVREREFWPASVEGPLLPLIVKRMLGRHTKKRRRKPLELRTKPKPSSQGQVGCLSAGCVLLKATTDSHV